MQICIFEDKNAGNFEPLSYYRPVFELVCGINTLREKILRYYPGVKNSVMCREYLAALLKEKHPGLPINRFEDDDYLFINGRILADESLPVQVNAARKDDILFFSGNILVGAKISRQRMSAVNVFQNDTLDITSFTNIKKEEVNLKLLNYTFELIKYNHDELIDDFKYAAADPGKIRKFTGVHLLEKNNIVIEEGAKIKPGVVLDASDGPIFIGKNVMIYPNSVIEGPVFIGESSIIKSCSTIYSNVSIGKICKAGGEIEDTIMLDYSNKQHSGFIGHAYLGSWINLGADTNCSDLKNNYSNVKITLNGKQIDTGMQFLGLLMGDHSKTAINTMLNTGTVAGFSSNIFGAGFPDKYIPSFSWGGANEMMEYDIDKSIGTAKKVLERRNVRFTAAEENAFRKIFEMTRKDRFKKEMVNND